MYLLDSDYIINFLHGEKHAIEMMDRFQQQALFTSIICVGEILEGLYLGKHKKKISQFEDFLKNITIIEIDRKIVEQFARIRASLRKEGKLIDNLDLLIASSCLAYDLILVTHNIVHFQRISKLKIYHE